MKTWELYEEMPKFLGRLASLGLCIHIVGSLELGWPSIVLTVQ